MVPRVFYRIWLDEEVPARYERFWERFQELNPGWDFVTLDRSDDLGWMRPHVRDVFERCQTHAGRSDVLRYEVVYQWGGVYVDCDVEPLQSFEPLLDTDRPFAGWENAQMICPTVFGSPIGHPALGAVLDALPMWFEEHKGAPPNQSTGPHLLTHVWELRSDVTLYDPVVFYPVGWWEKRKLGGPYPPEALSVHWWDARWLPGGPPQRG